MTEGGGVATDDLLMSRILVVDDEEANVELLRRILARAGYSSVTGLTDARRVMDVVTQLRPDLVLLDLLMPGVDGFEVMRSIREGTPSSADLPILVLTADAGAEARHRSLAEGATDFLAKPLDNAEVLLRIHNLLRMHVLHVELRNQKGVLQDLVRARTAELQESVEELRRVEEQRRLLSFRLVNAQEEERARIAAKINEQSIQKMAAVSMRVEALRARVAQAGLGDSIAAIGDVTRDAIESLRELLFELRPPALDREGLDVAVAQLGRRLTDGSIAFHVENRMASGVSNETRVNAYRIVQEALANVRSNPTCSNVGVVLETTSDGLLVRIEDDADVIACGDAGSSAGRHEYVAGIRARAELAGGWCQLLAAGGTGTAVECLLPEYATTTS
jgi:CheY-like chemotaxis protein